MEGNITSVTIFGYEHHLPPRYYINIRTDRDSVVISLRERVLNRGQVWLPSGNLINFTSSERIRLCRGIYVPFKLGLNENRQLLSKPNERRHTL